MTVLRSRDNPRVRAWMQLASEPRERRRRGSALIEGQHLVEAYLARGGAPAALIVSESGLAKPEIAHLVSRAGRAPTILADAVFARIADTESPAGVAAEIPIPVVQIDPAQSAACVFLEGIQDAGNLGTLLRSAAAFGLGDVLLAPGCTDPWSPKALRAGMGGHFSLRIAASADLARDVVRFGPQSVCTVVRYGEPIHALKLSGRIGWIFGAEGAGVSAGVAAVATRKATIPMPGGTESLNVAASAAICFYERARQLSRCADRS